MWKDFIINIKENKPFICIILFSAYSTGLFAYYSGLEKLVGAIFTFLILFILFFLFFNKKYSNLFSPYFILFLYFLFIFGFLNAKINYVKFDDFFGIEKIKNVEIKGMVSNIPNCSEKRKICKFPFIVQEIKIQNEKTKIDKGIVFATINIFNKKYIPKFGDTLNLTGTINTPLAATNPSEFDYQKFLNNKGILKTFYAKEYKYISSPDIKQIKNKKSLFEKLSFLNICFTRCMNNLRDKVILTHSKYMKSPNLEILGGIVFGDDAINPPDDVKEAFINSGLLHLLAASGLNVTLILSMWLCIVHFINIHYRLKILSGLFIVCLYMTMTGFPPSIVRASVMLILILFGKFIYRDANGVSLIFIAGLIITLFKPEFILDVGFQLSFLVTLGLIVCIPCLTKALEKRERNYIKKLKGFNKFFKILFMAFSPVSVLCIIMVPLTAQIWAAPLQAFYFNTFSIYSVLANIAVVPFVGIISFLGFISSAFCFIPLFSKLIIPIFDVILNFLIQIVLNISNYFSTLKYSIIKVPSPNIFQIVIYYFLVVLLFAAIKNYFKNKIINYSLFILVVVFLFSFISFENKKGEIIFFNSGNADNFIVKTDENKYIMIDSGKFIYPESSSAKRITLEYLYDKNIKEIDLLILTHYDADHSGGLIDILDEIKVKNLVIPKPECNSKNSCKIKKYIEENNVKYILPYTKQRFSFDNDIEVINYVPKSSNKLSKNDSSTVTFIKYKNFKFLFLADIPSKSFHSIEKFMPNDVDILKASHHGAKRTVDDEILNKLRPKYTVILTGQNPYNHPDYETVMLYKKYSKVFNTKETGAIKFEIKENELVPYTFKNKHFEKEKTLGIVQAS